MLQFCKDRTRYCRNAQTGTSRQGEANHSVKVLGGSLVRSLGVVLGLRFGGRQPVSRHIERSSLVLLRLHSHASS